MIKTSPEAYLTIASLLDPNADSDIAGSIPEVIGS